MRIIDWEQLPKELRNDKVRPYYDILRSKQWKLRLKRLFDLVVSLLLFVIALPLLVIISVMIKIDSKGSIFYKQVRVTQYNKEFSIFKFRTMVKNADQIGERVTVFGDSRITNVGVFLRNTRLDELPQLFNIIKGEMSLVGVRPEVPEYVAEYAEEMYATLLLPAGVTSYTSIVYKDESILLNKSSNPKEIYINKILPKKMEYNLIEVKRFALLRDIKMMVYTVMAIVGVKIK